MIFLVGKKTLITPLQRILPPEDIAGARHNPYSSKTPPTHHHTTHKDCDSLFFLSSPNIAETRMLSALNEYLRKHLVSVNLFTRQTGDSNGGRNRENYPPFFQNQCWRY